MHRLHGSETKAPRLKGSVKRALEFGNWYGFIAVAVIYGLGQVVESFILTPRLVGERMVAFSRAAAGPPTTRMSCACSAAVLEPRIGEQRKLTPWSAARFSPARCTA